MRHVGNPMGTKTRGSCTHSHTLTTPPPEEAEELPDTQRQASLLDSAQTLFEKKMMMEAVNGEQVTFRRMDEILENVTCALDFHDDGQAPLVHTDAHLSNIVEYT